MLTPVSSLLSWKGPKYPPRGKGCQDQPPFNQLGLLHPVLFYRTQKIGKFGKLSRLCQTVALL